MQVTSGEPQTKNHNTDMYLIKLNENLSAHKISWEEQRHHNKCIIEKENAKFNHQPFFEYNSKISR